MNDPLHVANAPNKPVLIYDGDCRFCGLWVQRWRQATGGAVDYLPFQDERVAQRFPELARQRLETAVQFIDADGSVYQAAEAVFRCLAAQSSSSWLFRIYREKPWFARATEVCYRFVASHRTFFSWLTRILWGKHVQRPDYFLVRRLFLILLGAIYCIAFVSLWIQITGLIGKDGILATPDLMSQVRSAFAANGIGIDRYHILPTFCWWDTSDGFVKFQCAAGTVLALCLVAGVAPPICLVLLWCLYLSLATVGREFLSFQWDNLLLETGLLAIFVGPLQLVPRPSREQRPSRVALWLLRLLLFKLMFLSGVVKLGSGDPAWHSLIALTRHYETQPLPTWVAWYAHQLPIWFQKTSCVVMFVIELVAPFLIFFPRRLRMTGAFALAVLQMFILLTGNYTFFNWLTLALCVLVLDDFAVQQFLPRKITALYSQTLRAESAPAVRWRRLVIAPLAIVFVSVSVIQLALPFGTLPRWIAPVVELHRWLSPFRSINSYALFAVMTMERPEIIVEGSVNGRDWKEYEFPYKPGDVKRRPSFVAPYQPRLDWQMWFAALGNYRQNPWFVNFCTRLLQGSPEVLVLLQTNPFLHEPPRYIRARLYDYRFTTPEERRRTGAWWHRELRSEYLPPISLEMLRPKSQSQPTP